MSGSLPRMDNVVIPRDKLIYSLEIDINKRRLWRSMLDLGIENIDYVEQQIRDKVKKYKSVYRDTNPYGDRYFTVVLMASHQGIHRRVLTAWIDDFTKHETRLTTVFPLEDSDKREAIAL